MNASRAAVGKAAYGLAFCVLLPGALAAWAMALEPRIGLPRVHAPIIGGGVLAFACGLWAWSVWALARHGRGLPMNAFPPREPVSRGPYALTNHPIYVAFVLACAGVSLMLGSAAGLWLVTPLAALGAAALVLGYENDAFAAHFPGFQRRPLIRLPRGDGTATWSERLSIYPLALAPWLIIYEAIGHVAVIGAIDSRMPIERGWPVLAWAEPVYASPYVIVCLVPLLVVDRRILRSFAIGGLLATLVLHLLYLAIPLISPPRPIDSSGVFAAWLAMEHADGMQGRAAFPAFHVVWTVLAAAALARALPRALPLWCCWAIAVAASCVAVGMHSLADILAAAAISPVFVWWEPLLNLLRRTSERITNSWHEWRLGPLRIINYAGYTFISASLGMTLLIACAGLDLRWDAVIVALAALIGAGAWGQYWVGSRSLLRPFGYFGSVLGALAGMGIVWLLRGNDTGAVWRLCAGAAMCAPWVQSIGRLRCLVNGCCHGKQCPPEIGIRCTSPRSRIVRLSGLSGTPIHPTPLYSILANMVIGMLLIAMWRAGATAAHLTGTYLIGQGLARFVEEHYRGEPHTPIHAGLRLYQWFALGSVVCGMAIATIPSAVIPPSPTLSITTILVAAAVGLVYAFAMGMDFPASNRRFSRLA